MSSRRSGTAGRTWCALWVAVLLLLGGEEAARATTCLGRPLWASPPPATVLPLNPRILISFYPSSKVDSYRPYLAGPGHSVNLEKMGEHPLGRAVVSQRPVHPVLCSRVIRSNFSKRWL